MRQKSEYFSVEQKKRLNLICITALVFIGLFIFFVILPIALVSIYCDTYVFFFDPLTADAASLEFVKNLQDLLAEIFWGVFPPVTISAYGLLFLGAVTVFLSFFFFHDGRKRPSKILALTAFCCAASSLALMVTAIVFKSSAAFVYFSLLPVLVIIFLAYKLYYQKSYAPVVAERGESELDLVKREVLRDYKMPAETRRIVDSFESGSETLTEKES